MREKSMYEIETIYDKETLIEFQKVVDGTLRAKQLRIMRILLFVLGVCGFVLGGLWIYFGQIVPALSGFVMGAAFLAVGIFYEKYRMMGKKHDVSRNLHKVTYVFNREYYGSEDSTGVHKTAYTAIKNICESDTVFAIMIGRRQGFVLDKKRFVRGTPEQFRAFIEKKTGLSVQTLQ